jgi:hypothetical protein
MSLLAVHSATASEDRAVAAAGTLKVDRPRVLLPLSGRNLRGGVLSAMNKPLCLTALCLTVALGSPVFAQLQREEAIRKAETILGNLQAGRVDDIVKEFDAKMTAGLPGDKLKGAWGTLVAQFGAFKSITERREGQAEGRQAVELFLVFEKETIVNRTVFDSAGKIAGLVFRPTSAALLPAKQ